MQPADDTEAGHHAADARPNVDSVHEQPDLELLALVAAITPAGSDAVASDVIAAAKYEADVAAGRPAMRTTTPPYFGLDGSLWALERAGLIEIDPGIASATLPGRAASTPKEVFVIVTPAGAAALDH